MRDGGGNNDMYIVEGQHNLSALHICGIQDKRLLTMQVCVCVCVCVFEVSV